MQLLFFALFLCSYYAIDGVILNGQKAQFIQAISSRIGSAFVPEAQGWEVIISGSASCKKQEWEMSGRTCSECGRTVLQGDLGIFTRIDQPSLVGSNRAALTGLNIFQRSWQISGKMHSLEMYKIPVSDLEWCLFTFGTKCLSTWQRSQEIARIISEETNLYFVQNCAWVRNISSYNRLPAKN